MPAEKTLYEFIGNYEKRISNLERQIFKQEQFMRDLTSKEKIGAMAQRIIVNGEDVYIDTEGVAKLLKIIAKDSSGLGLYADDGTSGLLIEDNGNVELLRSLRIGSAGDPGDNNLHVDGNITVNGTVDGRDIASDGSKLDGIESGADVTDEANVRAALASLTAATNFNGKNITNVGTVDGRNVSTDGSKLDGIESGADVTDFTNVHTALQAATSSVDFNTQNLVDIGEIQLDGSYKIRFRASDPDSAIFIHSNADGFMTLDADNGINLDINGSKTADIDSDAINMNGSNKLQFRDGNLYIQSEHDGHLDLNSDDSIDFNIGGSTIANVDSTGIDVSTNKRIEFRDSAIYLFSESDSVLKAVADGYLEIDAPYTRPGGDKTQDLGQSNPAWDDIYCDVLHETADIPFLDEKDDLAAINKIKGSGVIDPRTGLELIDDNTLEEWLLSKSKDGKNILRDGQGKPYYNSSTIIGLLMGAIRQLDAKINNIM